MSVALYLTLIAGAVAIAAIAAAWFDRRRRQRRRGTPAHRSSQTPTS